MEQIVINSTSRAYRDQQHINTPIQLTNEYAEATLTPLWRTLDRLRDSCSQNNAFKIAQQRLGGKMKNIFNKKLPNLTLAGKTTKNVDALSRDGKIYSIKCVSSPNGTTGSFWDPEGIRNNNKTFDYLIIVILDDEYGVDKMLELSWDDFMKHKSHNTRMNNYNVSITKKLTEEFKVVYKK